MAITIKRVMGGYLLIDNVKESGTIVSVVKNGEEDKILQEILGHIFWNYLYEYGMVCTIDTTITHKEPPVGSNDDYVCSEFFPSSDEVGCDYSSLHKKGGDQ